jgi:sugar phosphate isomerase/epimerase
LNRFADRFAGFCEAAARHGLTADLEFMPWTCVPNLATASQVVAQAGQPNGGILVDALHFDRSNSSTAELARVPVGRLHYWQICDAPAERPTTTDALIHAARYERMFPGEGGIDLKSLARAMPADIVVSIEVPTVELAKTVDARTRAQRAIDAARKVIAAATT